MKGLLQVLVITMFVSFLTSCESLNNMFQRKQQPPQQTVAPKPVTETLSPPPATEEENATEKANENAATTTPAPTSNVIPVGKTNAVTQEEIPPLKKKKAVPATTTDSSETVSDKPNTD